MKKIAFLLLTVTLFACGKSNFNEVTLIKKWNCDGAILNGDEVVNFCANGGESYEFKADHTLIKSSNVGLHHTWELEGNVLTLWTSILCTLTVNNVLISIDTCPAVGEYVIEKLTKKRLVLEQDSPPDLFIMKFKAD